MFLPFPNLFRSVIVRFWFFVFGSTETTPYSSPSRMDVYLFYAGVIKRPTPKSSPRIKHFLLNIFLLQPIANMAPTQFNLHNIYFFWGLILYLALFGHCEQNNNPCLQGALFWGLHMINKENPKGIILAWIGGGMKEKEYGGWSAILNKVFIKLLFRKQRPEGREWVMEIARRVHPAQGISNVNIQRWESARFILRALSRPGD